MALVTLDGQVLLHEFRPNRLLLAAGGAAEQDPEEWWQTIRDAIQAILSKNAAAAGEIAALSISSQWFGTVPVDARGRHLANAWIWLDQRGAPYVAERVGGGLEVPGTGYNAWRLWRWIRLTGAVPSRTGKDPVGHILGIKHERPELYRATYKFLEPMDYLTFRLTGRATASYASITGYFCTDNRDLERVDYDRELLSLCGLDREKLPDLIPTGSVVGPLTPECARELGLPEDVKVVTSSADTASAAIGAGAVQDYRAHLYIGTSAWISCHVPFKRTDLTRSIASLPSAIPDRYWVATEQDAAGKCLSWLVERVLYGPDELASEEAPADVYARLDRVAERAPAGSGGLLFLPWLNGERTPVDDRHIRGSWANLSLATDRGCLVRSVLEGVALNARWMLRAAEHFVARECPAGFESLRFVGGGARSELWCQILSDVLDRRIERVKEPVLANARGAALIAAVALGHLDWKSAAAKVEVDRVYQPNPAVRALYDRKFEAFLRFYKQTKGTYAWLNGDVS